MNLSSSMRCILILVAMILVGSVAVNSLDVYTDNKAQNGGGECSRSLLRIPKFFDFSWFTSKFHKVYPTMSEYLARKKIYLGNLMGVFVSQLAFKQKKSTYYLKVNQMADLSPDEVDAMFSNPDIIQQGLPKVDMLPEVHKSLHKRPIEQSDEDKVVDDSQQTIEVSECELDPQVAHDLKEVAEYEGQITRADEHSRRKRDTTPSRIKTKMAWGGSWFSRRDHKHHSDDDNDDDDDNSYQGTYHPDQVYSDLRGTGCLNRVKDQGKCGSCYIFSLMALYEFEHCLQTEQLLDLSEQYVLDCATSRNMVDGCEGGSPIDVVKFNNIYGLDLSSNYPYKKRVGKCPYPKDRDPSTMGYLRTSNVILYELSNDQVESVLIRSPVVLGMTLSKDYHRYGGGVHNPKSKCQPDHKHALTAIGYGRQDGVEYYLFRDSHSTHFGESGYYKLAKESIPYCALQWTVTSGLLNPDYADNLVEHVNPHYSKG